MTRRRLHSLAALLCLALLPSLHACSVPGGTADAHEIRHEQPGVVRGEVGRAIHAYLSGAADHGFDGVVAVEIDGELVVHQAYGIADRSSGRAATLDTLYALGSLSKSFTAALALDLATKGELDLEARLDTLLPDVPDDKSAITPAHLIAHTSGLGYHPSFAEPDSREACLVALLAEPMVGTPGDRFAYSNVGYTLLAHLCERAGRAPFEELVLERVIAPVTANADELARLGLRGEAHALELPYARSTMGGGDQGTPREWNADERFLGAGGVVGTATGALAWLRAVTPEAAAPRATIQGPTSYAAGWFVSETLRGTRVVFHAGDFMAFNAEARWYPEEGRRIVLLSNAREGGVGMREPVLHRVALLAAGEEVANPPRIVGAEAADLSGVCGRWEPRGAEGHLTVVASETGVTVSTSSAEVVASFTSADPDLPARLDTKARDLVTAASDGRDEAIASQMHPAVVRGASETPLLRAWRDAEARFGALEPLETTYSVARGFSVARGSDGSGASFVPLRGERGEGWLRIAWMDERLLGASVGEGPSIELHALGDGAFGTYDLFQDGLHVLAPTLEPDELRWSGPHGTLLLTRVSDAG